MSSLLCSSESSKVIKSSGGLASHKDWQAVMSCRDFLGAAFNEDEPTGVMKGFMTANQWKVLDSAL